MSAAKTELRSLVYIGDAILGETAMNVCSYASFLDRPSKNSDDDAALQRAESIVVPSDVLSLQFTSGESADFRVAFALFLHPRTKSLVQELRVHRKLRL